ncbi:sigma-54-dependent transcriptional regulator [Hydrogenothermus marinus]|uniref:DNA-binding NtrC family response regulator n=1 Tax=Hydrogenothermus marinus TaxID=133270 RepID=A0A3M0BIP6_9AQUI|nr:sigma-54 dependent transcriptional regulator [Hydrogenothermus marinus]RMA97260.1 DNA-binding NtrC family response regulator [Hydrogenothermus marinus]
MGQGNLSILVVDDEENIRNLVQDILEDEGYFVETAISIKDAKQKLKEKEFDIIFLDVWLPDGDGIELISDIKQSNKNAKIVMISGHANIPIAVKALKLGAYDFLEKPISTEAILAILEKAEEEIKKEIEFEFLKQKEETEIQIIGESPPIRKLKQQIQKVAKTNAWVLIYGENGTGKELVAKSIHYLSDRADKPFVDINCAAIPDDLFEAELFGYEKGAFTNAVSRKIGKLEIASGGTLFLDEVADLSLKAQAKLLRVLEEKTFTRLGGNQKIKVDLRVISATNKNIDEEIEKGNFRQDLAFRLSVIPLKVPPLRERGNDIILLAEHFLKVSCIENKMDIPEISEEVKKAFLKYLWPGNVRELKNLMERLCIFSTGKITIEDLPDYITGKQSKSVGINFGIRPLKEVREMAEKEVIKKALEKYGNKNLKQIAKILEVDLSSLYRKIKQYNLD